MNNEFAVKVNNVSKVYKMFKSPGQRLLHAFSNKVPHKDFYAVKNMTVEFPKGETIGIIGKNGSGKSTLLKMITGISRPTEGTIETNGRIVAMLELTAGFDKEISGLENIYFKGRTIGFTKEEIDAKIDEIAAFADIGDFINQPVRTYSSGMKSRLGFAVSVHLDPEILIVDEVLAVGDATFRLKCLSKMEEIRKQGTTILFVSHSLATVKAFCTYCAWINEGVLMDYGECGAVVQKYEDFLKGERKEKREKLREESDEKLILTTNDIIHTKKARLCDDLGKEQTVFEMGDDICIFSKYEIKTETGELTCGITLYDHEGRELFDSDLHNSKFVINNEIGKHSLAVHIHSPELLPGHYSVTCEIWDTVAGLKRDVIKDQTFEVVSDEFFGTGVMALRFSCESE